LDDLKTNPLSEPVEGEGIRGRALDLISFEPEMAPAVTYLLGNTFFVEDIQTANGLAQRCRPGTRLATITGELIVAGGEVKKVASGRERISIVSRENVIAEFEEQISELGGMLKNLDEELLKARRIRSEIEGNFNAAKKFIQRLEIELAEARGDEKRADLSCSQLESESISVAQEVEEIVARQKDSTLRTAALEAKLSESDGNQSECNSKLKMLDGELSLAVQEHQKKKSAETEQKVALATAVEKESSLINNLKRIDTDSKTVEQTISERTEQIERGGKRRDELSSEIGHLSKEIQILMSERTTTDSDVRQHSTMKAELYEKLKTTDERLKAQIQEEGELRDQASGFEVQIVRQQAEIDGIVARLKEQYDRDIRGLKLDAGIDDWDGIKEKIEKSRERLKRLGPVNMIALEEHRELEGRLNFLTEQEHDLLTAKESLTTAIDKINRETTRMFSETFQAIKENFQEIYKDLFGGGTANLLLEEGVDILEAGINIVARPPGKKLQSISLLSGGERALTAIALLFSIYKVKPSPFCVLDEIDAPLDESNINRFIALLEKFLKHSQFIIVTHNKRTISMADIMYGITMEESGVSKVVSAKISTKHHNKKLPITKSQ
jgi:chromosome segregation protein